MKPLLSLSLIFGSLAAIVIIAWMSNSHEVEMQQQYRLNLAAESRATVALKKADAALVAARTILVLAVGFVGSMWLFAGGLVVALLVVFWNWSRAWVAKAERLTPPPQQVLVHNHYYYQLPASQVWPNQRVIERKAVKVLTAGE